MNASTHRTLTVAVALALASPALAQSFTTQFTLHAAETGTAPPVLGFNAKLPNSPTLAAQDVLLADFDGDGDVDAYVVSSGQDSYYENGGQSTGFADPQGEFFDRTSFVTRPANGATDGAVGDMNGDGQLDIVLAVTQGSGPGAVLYFENALSSTSTFDDRSQLALLEVPNFANVRCVALVDWNGDGHLDIFAGAAPRPGFTSGLFYLENSGTMPPTFTEVATGIPAVTGNIHIEALATGDIDGDGDPDLFAGLRSATGGAGTHVLITGNGSGAFTDSTATAGLSGLPSRRSSGAELADVDNDGDLDLITANKPELVAGFWINGSEQLFLNDGTGVFAAPQPLPSSGDASNDLAVGDVDGDGDLDVVTVNETFGSTHGGTRLYLFDNSPMTGPGFVDAPGRIQSDSQLQLNTQGVALADVDLDGDPDLFTAVPTESSLRFHPNALSQIDAPRLINTTSGFVDYELTFGFDVGFYDNTVRSSYMVLHLSVPPQQAWGHLPSVGFIAIDQNAVALSPGLIPDASGTASLTLRIPQNTTLTFIVQGLGFIIPSNAAQTLATTNVIRTVVQ